MVPLPLEKATSQPSFLKLAPESLISVELDGKFQGFVSVVGNYGIIPRHCADPTSSGSVITLRSMLGTKDFKPADFMLASKEDIGFAHDDAFLVLKSNLPPYMGYVTSAKVGREPVMMLSGDIKLSNPIAEPVYHSGNVTNPDKNEYSCSSDYGNCGSPVFNTRGQIIGLHISRSTKPETNCFERVTKENVKLHKYLSECGRKSKN
jgi:hypothetical protein